MQTENKPIESWLEDIRRGVVRLPRFQRREAWTYKHVENFLATVILHDRPIGVLLTLEVDSVDQPFETRSLEGTVNNGEKCRYHLLDGQQRLTALWKALNDKYEDRVYFVVFKEENESFICNSVKGVSRKTNPWVENLSEAFNKNLIPVSLLNPKVSHSEIEVWLKNVADEHQKTVLRELVMNLWKRVSSKPFPSLPLPQSTEPDEAIDIFINTNTSFVRLTPYNIAVAMFEADTQESLQGVVDKVGQEVSGIIDLEGEDGLGDLILKVACLFQNMMPTYGNYRKLDMLELKRQQNKILEGIRWATDTLNKEKIWTERQLPSSVPLRVLPALFRFLPKRGDDRAKADRLVRQYVWRSFVTDRYDRQANDRLKKDYDAIQKALQNKRFQCSDKNTVFAEQLPNKEELLSEGWPRSKGIRKRAVLAICTREGSRDIASNIEISPDEIRKRQYHHIFPKGLLRKVDSNPDLALNCMLIDEPTNQDWSDRWPGDYILERIEQSGFHGEEAKQELRQRLESHFVPPDAILNAIDGGSASLQQKYEDFLKQRAELIIEKIGILCRGKTE
ncbi:MAG: DUF262 domain-containing protein [Gammaproteobacteria bacterium]|nr:DUF262 domain-containing protein [Gammaproteobacteria bacterium]MCY4339713.1 DUF262 domain-containing protein [Gammaproteobacteria bacterium]